MSDYHSHIGKLKLVNPQNGESFDELCRRVWKEENMEDKDYESDCLTYGFPGFTPRYVISDKTLYKVIEHEDLDPEDSFVRINKNEDGTLSFTTRYYDGGTCFNEMIEDGLKEFNGNGNQNTYISY